jgi:hypothetical protein
MEVVEVVVVVLMMVLLLMLALLFPDILCLRSTRFPFPVNLLIGVAINVGICIVTYIVKRVEARRDAVVLRGEDGDRLLSPTDDIDVDNDRDFVG